MLNLQNPTYGKISTGETVGQTLHRDTIVDPMPGILKELREARMHVRAADVLHGFAIEALDKAYTREKAAQDALYAILK
jgi:hypothetical protein